MLQQMYHAKYIALLAWRLKITLFSSYMPSVQSLPEATHKVSGHVAKKGKRVFLQYRLELSEH